MNKRRLYWIIFATAAVLTILALFLLLRTGLNAFSLGQYEKEHYSEMPETLLTVVNVPEGYIPCYNLGNEAYRMKNYDRAVSWYRQALDRNPPEGKECPIRVNLALAMLQKIDFEHLDDPSVRKNAVSLLKAARKVLCEQGCADPDGTDGHDEKAEKLKEEIDELLKELEDEEQEDESESETETESEPQTQPETEPQTSSSNQSKNNRREQDVEKQIRKNQEQASSERGKDRKTLDQYLQGSGSQEQQESGGGSGGGDDKPDKFW